MNDWVVFAIMLIIAVPAWRVMDVTIGFEYLRGVRFIFCLMPIGVAMIAYEAFLCHGNIVLLLEEHTYGLTVIAISLEPSLFILLGHMFLRYLKKLESKGRYMNYKAFYNGEVYLTYLFVFIVIWLYLFIGKDFLLDYFFKGLN